MKYPRSIAFCLIFVSISILIPAAEKLVGEGVVFHPEKAPTPPKIDAILDDQVWQKPPIISGFFIANRPVYGEKLSQKTHRNNWIFTPIIWE